MIRIPLGLLSFHHGVFAMLGMAFAAIDQYQEMAAVLMLMVLVDAACLIVAVAGPFDHLFVWISVVLNVSEAMAILASPLLHPEDAEFDEGLGMLIASGWVPPLLGPLGINAILLSLMVLTDGRKKLPTTDPR